jgi:HAD superfamily hydrolase (TIGR01484 family)
LTDINPLRDAGPAAPWRTCPASRLAGLHGIFTDVDDTLTRDGAIEPAALAALRALRQAGVPVIAVTGRPMGWSRPFAREWPLEAIVAENGAVALRREAGASDGLRIDYLQDEATRERNARQLQDAARRILARLPHARLAQDSPGRVTDIAVDHSEHARLDDADIATVVALMREAGMTATVSSIHVNGWFGDHDKWAGARWALRLLHGRELQPEAGRWLFVGDSTNDQVMFERFPLSVGVANLRRFAAQLRVWPAYLTEAERGEGFAEVARAVLAARGAA